METKQTLGSLVSGVLQELNVTFLFVPESPGNLVQQIWSAPYARPVSVTVLHVWRGLRSSMCSWGKWQAQEGKAENTKTVPNCAARKEATAWHSGMLAGRGEWSAELAGRAGTRVSERRGSNLEVPQITKPWEERTAFLPPPGSRVGGPEELPRELWAGFSAPDRMSCELDAFKGFKVRAKFAAVCWKTLRWEDFHFGSDLKEVSASCPSSGFPLLAGVWSSKLFLRNTSFKRDY